MFRLLNLVHTAPLTSRSRTVYRYSHLKRCLTRSCLEIEEKLRNKFEEFKPIDSTPLYRDFDTYKMSLPVRERDCEWLKLHELPYFGTDDDVKVMAEKLYDPKTAVRKLVRYVCAPATSGKTTCVLPAFLESKFCTHYLYIAFDNNNKRQFKLSPYKPMDDTDCAERQGAAFAYECVRKLIKEPDKQGPHNIEIEVDDESRELPTQDVSSDKLKKLLASHFGEQSCILFHADEHRKMCERGAAENDPGISFCRGAMQTLAKAGIVVATYTSPPSVPALGSSGVCRRPIPMPQLDVQKLFQHLQLILPDAKSKMNHRLLTMFKFRFAMVFQPSENLDDPIFGLELGGLHRPATAEPQLNDFVDQLQLTLENKDQLEQKKVIKKCIKLCAEPTMIPSRTSNAYATHLLLGMSDKQMEEAVERVGSAGFNDLVVLTNGNLTTTLSKLLSLEDERSRLNAIYAKGCKRFRALFHDFDLLCGLPLEEAYLWTISCRSAVESELRFPLGKNVFDIHCTDIKPARIFPTWSTKEFDVTSLEPHVMYYADEPGRGDHDLSHPCADMFFRTAADELVLIDITGSGNPNKVDKKAEKLRKVIPKMQKALRIGEQMETHDLSHMHTHMQTHARLQVQTHSCTHHACTLTHTHMHTSHICTNARAYTHTHVYTNTFTHLVCLSIRSHRVDYRASLSVGGGESWNR